MLQAEPQLNNLPFCTAAGHLLLVSFHPVYPPTCTLGRVPYDSCGCSGGESSAPFWRAGPSPLGRFCVRSVVRRVQKDHHRLLFDTCSFGQWQFVVLRAVVRAVGPVPLCRRSCRVARTTHTMCSLVRGGGTASHPVWHQPVQFRAVLQSFSLWWSPCIRMKKAALSQADGYGRCAVLPAVCEMPRGCTCSRVVGAWARHCAYVCSSTPASPRASVASGPLPLG